MALFRIRSEKFKDFLTGIKFGERVTTSSGGNLVREEALIQILIILSLLISTGSCKSTEAE